MAKRIYDQTLGQLAGVQVTTDGLGNIVRDGTEAYAQMTVSASGQPIASTAGTGNLVSLSGATVAAGSISFSANNQYAIIDTQGFEGASFTVSGFGTATLAVQWSNLAASGFVAGTVSTVGSSTTGTTITANGQYTAASGGRYMKVLVTAFTTGPIVVTPVLIAGSSVGGSGGGAAAGGLTDTAATSGTGGSWTVPALLRGILNTLLASVTEMAPRPWRVDYASFRTKTIIAVAGADTDELLAPGAAGIRTFVYGGFLQTDIACVLTFKAGANAGASTAIFPPISLAAGQLLDLSLLGGEEPEIYTGTAEGLYLTKSTAATINGVLFSKGA